MGHDYIPRRDSEAVIFYHTLLNALAVQPAAYGLEAEAVATLQARSDELRQTLDHMDQLNAERSAVAQQKRELRAQVEGGVRTLVQQIQADPAVTDHLKAQAGIPLPDMVLSHAAPVPPTDLTVDARANGEHFLKWKRSHNPQHTEFLVEAKMDGAQEFTLVDVVRAARYHHTGLKPGAEIVYRVRARHSGQTSEPGNQAGVYLK